MRTICLLALAGLALLPGCDGQENQASPKSPTDEVFDSHNVTAEDLTLSTDELKQKLAEATKWGEFTLEEIATGQYEGKAKSSDGELLNVEVRQTAEGIYARWTNADNTGGGSTTVAIEW